jgi:hypothetical protein
MDVDVKALREEALEETARYFLDVLGYMPDLESEEYEQQYRRQFALATKRHAAKGPAAAAASPAASVIAGRDKWPELRGGAPAERRFADTLRAERLAEIPKKEMRDWVVQAWVSVNDWMAVRDMAEPVFLRRVEAQYAAQRKRAEAEAKAALEEKRAKMAAALVIQGKIKAAGITPEGLGLLIDASTRVAPAPLKDKVAEFSVGERQLRVFETADPKVLMVLEKTGPERSQYAIERDKGLVADLKLFAQGQAT